MKIKDFINKYSLIWALIPTLINIPAIKLNKIAIIVIFLVCLILDIIVLIVKSKNKESKGVPICGILNCVVMLLAHIG